MSLLQQLGAASLANSTAEDRSAAQTSCTAILEQLAASIAESKRAVGSQHAGQGPGGDPIQAVQDGLATTQQQLQRLLHQHHQQLDDQPTLAQHSSSTAEAPLQVLQSLLQLAVGDVQIPTQVPATRQQEQTTKLSSQHRAMAGQIEHQLHQPQRGLCLPTSTAAATRSGGRHKRYVAAAHEALQLLPVSEIVQLPAASLAQALLLQPQLLEHVLETAAAAVMQPLLPAAARESIARDSAAFGPPSTSSSSSIQEVLSCHISCWQQLPAILAVNPLLLQKAGTILCSWCEQSGHPRLWQLTSIICRPAWQYLTTAAAAAALITPASPSAWGTPGPSVSNSRDHVQQSLAGAFQLLCSEPWQQQLMQVLTQQPSMEGLLQLLPLLPGCLAATAPADAAPGACRNWPSMDEWQQSCYWQTGRDRSATAVAGPSHSAAAAPVADECGGICMLKVLSIWRLVLQHRCWYQFACYMLVHSCSNMLSDNQIQPQQQQMAWYAASFIAWAQEPMQACRRSQVLQLLLAPCNTRTAVASAQELPSTTGVCSRCRHFMQCWRHALSSSDCWSTVVDVDLPVAVLHQQELLTACSPKELLELCLPEVLQQQQLDNLGPVDSGSSDLKSRNLRPKVVALLDAADDVSAAVVQLLQASMQCNAQVVSAPSLLSQQSQQQQHLLLEGCSHWLARQWVHEVFDRDRQDSSSRGFNTAAAAAGGAASVVQLAKRLLVAVTTCDRELKAVLSWLPA